MGTSATYILYVKALERLNRAHEAFTVARQWVTKSPMDPLATYTLGRLQIKQKHYKEALSSLAHSTHNDPSRPETFYQLALAHYKLKNYEDAMSACQSTLRLRREEEERNVMIRRATEQMQQTLAASGQPIPLPPAADKTTQTDHAFFILGKLFAREKRWEDAAAAFEEFGKRRPDAPEAHVQRAMALEKLNHPSQVYESYQRALQAWQQRCFEEGSAKQYFAAHKADAAVVNRLYEHCQKPFTPPAAPTPSTASPHSGLVAAADNTVAARGGMCKLCSQLKASV
jgi:tetratricopeptide (TPR) repeat protein